MMAAPLPAKVLAGQAMYGPWTLRGYDFSVFRVNCPYFWGVPVRRILDLYDRGLSPDHLDVGVGTGYLLDRCRKPESRQSITLVDLNPHSLGHAANRLARYDTTTEQADVLKPLPLPQATFGSASMNFLLHCLPGEMETKARALDHVAACVKPGGRIFGSTVLSSGVRVPLRTRAYLSVLNRRGIFHNRHDDLEALRTALAVRFPDHRLSVEGCTALFEAEVP